MTTQSDPDSKLPAGFDWRAFTPEDSPQTPHEMLTDPVHQALSTAAVVEGGPAHNFSGWLHDFSSGARVATNQRFELLEAAREQPVALIFGSYT